MGSMVFSAPKLVSGEKRSVPIWPQIIVIDSIDGVMSVLKFSITLREEHMIWSEEKISLITDGI